MRACYSNLHQSEHFTAAKIETPSSPLLSLFSIPPITPDCYYTYLGSFLVFLFIRGKLGVHDIPSIGRKDRFCGASLNLLVQRDRDVSKLYKMNYHDRTLCLPTSCSLFLYSPQR